MRAYVAFPGLSTTCTVMPQREMMLHSVFYYAMLQAPPKTYQFWQPWRETSECTRPCAGAKDLPSSRWRRERRDKAGGGYAKLRASHLPASDAPLDMTTPRGLPPPYSQSSGRQSRSTPRVSVITPTPRTSTKDAENSARREQLSDPVIDEHFRRSLGNDYSSLFDDTARTGSRVTVTGLSVDDHFAKALGDTWTKLQKSEPELPSAVAAKAPPPSPTGTTSETTPPAGSKLHPPRRGLVTI